MLRIFSTSLQFITVLSHVYHHQKPVSHVFFFINHRRSPLTNLRKAETCIRYINTALWRIFCSRYHVYDCECIMMSEQALGMYIEWNSGRLLNQHHRIISLKQSSWMHGAHLEALFFFARIKCIVIEASFSRALSIQRSWSILIWHDICKLLLRTHLQAPLPWSILSSRSNRIDDQVTISFHTYTTCTGALYMVKRGVVCMVSAQRGLGDAFTSSWVTPPVWRFSQHIARSDNMQLGGYFCVVFVCMLSVCACAYARVCECVPFKLQLM